LKTARRQAAVLYPGHPESSVMLETASLQQALRQTPPVRRGAIKRATQLANDSSYPSASTIEKISLLLADSFLASGRRN
jgi:hypothetical protein